jgi:hypothetical protein
VCRLCPGGLLAWACHPRTMGGCSVVGHTPHCHDLTWSLSLAVKIPRTSPRFVTTPQYSRGSPNPTPALPFHLSFTSGQWGWVPRVLSPAGQSFASRRLRSTCVRPDFDEKERRALALFASDTYVRRAADLISKVVLQIVSWRIDPLTTLARPKQ